MYQTKIKLLVIVFILLAVVSSCRRIKCYRCYYFYGYFTAVKANDTVYYYVPSPYNARVNFFDSLDKYINEGFRIDTLISGYRRETGGTGPDYENCDDGGNGSGSYASAKGVDDSCVFAGRW